MPLITVFFLMKVVEKIHNIEVYIFYKRKLGYSNIGIMKSFPFEYTTNRDRDYWMKGQRSSMKIYHGFRGGLFP